MIKVKVTEVAEKFAEALRRRLTPEEFAEMCRRNATPEYDDACASHDFCDANMVMLSVFEKLRVPTTDLGDDNPQTRLWNLAWEVAKQDHLTSATRWGRARRGRS